MGWHFPRRLAAFVAAFPCGWTNSEPVVVIDIYRAVDASISRKYPWEDNDAADLGGVLKYIHTELITEHSGNPLRQTRKNKINCIEKRRFKVRNPPALVNTTSFTDFGAFVTYDSGMATNIAQHAVIQQYGDFVGVQQACSQGTCDPRFPSSAPYYWFSVGNWCSNLPFSQKGTKQGPNPACLRLLGSNGYIMGGLCPGGIDTGAVPRVDPTGMPGCVYSYGEKSVVMLDDLVGIRNHDCGGRPCGGWADFRENCTLQELWRRFTADGRTEQVHFCVEYDSHPACDDCGNPACQALIGAGQPVELGLQFWRGRCDPDTNVRRAEAVAASFGIADAESGHRLVDPAVLALDIPCVYQGRKECVPQLGGAAGGPYCTRHFSGICQPCYIPGTTMGAQPPYKPACPLDVLEAVDYRGDRWPHPVCLSRKPTQLCCLYNRSCDGEPDPSVATLDDDGLTLVAARHSTPDMVLFLLRANPALRAVDMTVLRRAAHEQWGPSPMPKVLAQTVAAVNVFVQRPPPVLSEGMPAAIPPPAAIPLPATTLPPSANTDHQPARLNPTYPQANQGPDGSASLKQFILYALGAILVVSIVYAAYTTLCTEGGSAEDEGSTPMVPQSDADAASPKSQWFAR